MARQRSARPRCPVCRAPWLPHSDAALSQDCIDLGIQLQPVRDEVSTERRDQLDEPPPVPTDVVPLCCDRVYLSAPERVVDGVSRLLPIDDDQQ